MNDLIDRQSAIDALWKALYEYEDKTAKKFQESEDLDIQDWIEHRIFVQNMNDIDRQTILNLPPIQPERKKGEWSDGYRWQRCSLCKQTGKKSWNYCPNCGADMRGEQDEH